MSVKPPEPQEVQRQEPVEAPPEVDVVHWGEGSVVYSGDKSTDEWIKAEEDTLETLSDWE
jgi:hypothetical protein